MPPPCLTVGMMFFHQMLLFFCQINDYRPLKSYIFVLTVYFLFLLKSWRSCFCELWFLPQNCCGCHFAQYFFWSPSGVICDLNESSFVFFCFFDSTNLIVIGPGCGQWNRTQFNKNFRMTVKTCFDKKEQLLFHKGPVKFGFPLHPLHFLKHFKYNKDANKWEGVKSCTISQHCTMSHY